MPIQLNMLSFDRSNRFEILLLHLSYLIRAIAYLDQVTFCPPLLICFKAIGYCDCGVVGKSNNMWNHRKQNLHHQNGLGWSFLFRELQDTYQDLSLPGVDVFSLRFSQVIGHFLVTCSIENLLNLIDWRWWEESRDDRASLIYHSIFECTNQPKRIPQWSFSSGARKWEWVV